MKILKITILVFLLCMGRTYAQCGFNTSMQDVHPWLVMFNLGYADYQHADTRQGKTATGRISFARQFFTTENLSIGLETGLQTGNTMRFAIPFEMVEILGGVPVTGTIKPVSDVLATLAIPVNASGSIYATLKSGGSYRQLQMDRETINDLSEFNPEIQTGLGFAINDYLHANLFWQRIFGKNPDFKADPFTETGVMAHIPTQDAIYLGLTILF